MLIIGLGNPGEEYKKNRHNAGRIILDEIRNNNNFSGWKNDLKLKAYKSTGEIQNKKISLITPNTFMNNSGLTVSKIFGNKEKLSELIVVYDDIDIPFGKIKISYNKNSGGHNGLQSIINELKSDSFLRIRIGVCPVTTTGILKKPIGHDKVAKYLLSNFSEKQLISVKNLSKEVYIIVEDLIKFGKDKTMNKHN